MCIRGENESREDICVDVKERICSFHENENLFISGVKCTVYKGGIVLEERLTYLVDTETLHWEKSSF